jgi:hypothetical protein
MGRRDGEGRRESEWLGMGALKTSDLVGMVEDGRKGRF